MEDWGDRITQRAEAVGKAIMALAIHNMEDPRWKVIQPKLEKCEALMKQVGNQGKLIRKELETAQEEHMNTLAEEGEILLKIDTTRADSIRAEGIEAELEALQKQGLTDKTDPKVTDLMEEVGAIHARACEPAAVEEALEMCHRLQRKLERVEKMEKELHRLQEQTEMAMTEAEEIIRTYSQEDKNLQ
jgi:hypothetical protein